MTERSGEIPEGFKMTELGPLPEEWEVVRLRDVAVKTRQRDPKRTPDRQFKYIDVSSIDREGLRITGYTELTGNNAPSRARKQIKGGDVLFATVRPYLRRVGLVPQELDNQVCSTAFCVIRAAPDTADSAYLFYVASHGRFVQQVAEHQRGSSYPAVSDKDVLSQTIPLPPLCEQKKIAAVLSAVQEAKEKTEAVIRAAKELKKSLVKHLFTYGPVRVEEAEKVPLKETEIGLVPEHWDVVKLGQLARIRYGLGQPPAADSNGVPMIRATNIKRGRIVRQGLVSVRRDQIPVARDPFLKAGDVIVVRSGAYTGDVAMVTPEWEGAIAGYDLIVSPEEHLVSPFCAQYLLGEGAQMYFKGQRARSAQPHLNSHELGCTQVPLPTVAEQRDIADALSAVDEIMQASEVRRATLEQLFKTLLNDLMTARIRVKDLEVEA
jgi:type I restriction enzyme S subunit